MKSKLQRLIDEQVAPVVESIESDELVLFADNDGQLYKSSTTPIQKNLSKKWKAGKYDHNKAIKLWQYHADRAAKEYARQFANPKEWNKIFSTKDRKEAAKEFADNWRDEMESGNLHESVINEEVNEAKDMHINNILEGNASDLIAKVFPKLKKGVAIKVSFDSSFSKDDARTLIVKSKSKSKKYNQEKITLYPEGQPHLAKFFIYHRKDTDNYSFALGNLGAIVTYIDIAKANENNNMKSKEQILQEWDSLNEKTDLTRYSDSELSMMVFNDEGLYNMRHERGFIRTLKSMFKFNKAQGKELIQDLKDDLDESVSDNSPINEFDKSVVAKNMHGDPNPISKRDLNSVKSISKKIKQMPRGKSVENMAYNHFVDGSEEREALLEITEAIYILESAVDRVMDIF